MANAIEALLSDTADKFEIALARDPAVAGALVALVKAGQTPHIFRVLRDVPGAVLRLVIEPEPT